MYGVLWARRIPSDVLVLKDRKAHGTSCPLSTVFLLFGAAQESTETDMLHTLLPSPSFKPQLRCQGILENFPINSLPKLTSQCPTLSLIEHSPALF